MLMSQCKAAEAIEGHHCKTRTGLNQWLTEEEYLLNIGPICPIIYETSRGG